PVLEKLSVLTGLGGLVFRGAPNLMEIYLDGNQIRSLHDATFSELPRLEVINLSQNKLPALPPRLLERVSSGGLKTFDLENNSVSLMPDGFFSSKPELPYVYLTNNPWLCSCAVGYLHSYLNDQEHNVYVHDGPNDIVPAADSVVCYGPPHLLKRPIIELEENDFCPPDPPDPPTGDRDFGPSHVLTTTLVKPIFITQTPTAPYDTTTDAHLPDSTNSWTSIETYWNQTPGKLTQLPLNRQLPVQLLPKPKVKLRLNPQLPLNRQLPVQLLPKPKVKLRLNPQLPLNRQLPVQLLPKPKVKLRLNPQLTLNRQPPFRLSPNPKAKLLSNLNHTLSGQRSHSTPPLDQLLANPNFKVPANQNCTRSRSEPNRQSRTTNQRWSTLVRCLGSEWAVAAVVLVAVCWLCAPVCAVCSHFLFPVPLAPQKLPRPLPATQAGGVTLRVYRRTENTHEWENEGESVSFLPLEQIKDAQAVFRSVLFISKDEQHQMSETEGIVSSKIELVEDKEQAAMVSGEVFRKTLYRVISREEEAEGWMEEEEHWAPSGAGTNARYSLILREERGRQREKQWVVGEWEIGGGGVAGQSPLQSLRSDPLVDTIWSHPSVLNFPVFLVGSKPIE
ncbi:hypothetical protein M9458_054703, partial [Cirrhinus mrigala]